LLGHVVRMPKEMTVKKGSEYPIRKKVRWKAKRETVGRC
jgi:hypothetical protein